MDPFHQQKEQPAIWSPTRLIRGIDRILDMARTSVNAIEDTSAAAVIAATEGELHLPDSDNKVSA